VTNVATEATVEWTVAANETKSETTEMFKSTVVVVVVVAIVVVTLIVVVVVTSLNLAQSSLGVAVEIGVVVKVVGVLKEGSRRGKRQDSRTHTHLTLN